MTGRTLTVEELITQVAAAVYDRRLGYLAVTGTLTDWRRLRYGGGSGVLAAGEPPRTRLPIHAAAPAADAIDHDFAAAGYDPRHPAAVTAHGQIVIHPRWGLQLDTKTIDLHEPHASSLPLSTSEQAGNHTTAWPGRIDTIGLVDPIDGDDARNDVLAVLDHLPVTVLEHRVPMTGGAAVLRICRALDTLASDHRPDITVVIRGGGGDIDLDVFNHPAVCAAIARHPRPVVTGIGHATNHTASDHAAHTSCITPTSAAHTILTATERRS